jgi:RNA-binding protein|tara:strand:- start:301 stop:573 length:273 start_codon:yes stop_codon:yes gene_type:complete
MDIPNAVKRNALDSNLEITMRIGKLGVNESVIEELKQQLLKRKMVKMKLNKGLVNGSVERSDLLNHISMESNSVLVHSRGNIAVFWYKGN